MEGVTDSDIAAADAAAMAELGGTAPQDAAPPAADEPAESMAARDLAGTPDKAAPAAPAAPAKPLGIEPIGGAKPGQPAAPAVVAPVFDYKTGIKSFEDIEASLDKLPPEQRPMVEHMLNQMVPHYEAVVKLQDSLTAKEKEWTDLVADAKARGVDAASADKLATALTEVTTLREQDAARQTAYTNLTRDSFYVMAPDFNKDHPLAAGFIAQYQRGDHWKLGTANDSEAKRMAALWKGTVEAAQKTFGGGQSTQAATQQRAALAATAVSNRPAAATLAARPQTTQEILDEVEKLQGTSW